MFDIIVPISYGTGREKLTNSTEAITRRAAILAQQHPEAKVVLSCCSYIFPGSEDVEWKLRNAIFSELGLNALRAGNMNNSVQEAMAIAEYIVRHKLSANRVLVVTGEFHSPSAKLIYEQVMPKSKISITCVGSKFEWQPDHPVLVQRTEWKWFLANIARQILLRTPGIGLRIGHWNHRSEK